MKKIRKAVIPAAGTGTRFLPATKAQPKEMLPIVDKPVIQYVVEECVASGIEDIIIVNGWHKRSIEDHFDYPFELEKRLEQAGKLKELDEIRKIAAMANFVYIRQKGPYGNATPVINAQHIIGDEPFVVVWGDEFFQAQPPRIKQCIEVYEEYGNPVIAGMKLTKEEVVKYGCPEVEEVAPSIYNIKRVIEKPTVEEAPSEFAITGCYLLTPEFFPILNNLPLGKSNELWLTDALDVYSKTKTINLKVIDGKYHDCGNKLSFLKANIAIALEQKDIADALKAYIRSLNI